ncbi:phospholipid scramblase 2 isoform X1 [Zootermopsis nevadensis]|uniref:phospholipid scramblase 2 isoform X1 n=1 Tax=Zootermopsis nevadensis TaxID=136037 RepID=UPI000B8EC3F2|nr:phospholipid scramblase 2 isoform X1 [Zootermopsis nevadensis]XP_021940950.1 phospholipid scramblase 2 isoform X1 [Zootermopsis nevadensis]
MSYPPPGQQGYPPPYSGQGQPLPPGGYQPPPGQVGFQPHPGFVPPGGQPGYQPQGYQQPGYQPQGYQPQGYQPQGYPPPGGYGQPIAAQPTSGGTPAVTGYGYNSAIMTPYQPQQGGWMNMPQGNPNVPPGLEYLTTIDQLLVHQKVELLEAFTGFETQNKYTIKNSVGQKVYYAVEDSDCLTRNCCGPLRPFDMKILDNYKNEVIHLNRPLACDSCWFPCCLQNMEVSSPPGTVIGSIQQEWSILTPQFNIKNAAGDVVLKIEGPICTFSICGDVEFKILSKDGSSQVGKISKQWAGLLREAFTDADYFGITFPMDLDVKMKAVMMGACFLIDVMFFEKQGNRESDRPGMF